jgi:hypothetical protein
VWAVVPAKGDAEPTQALKVVHPWVGGSAYGRFRDEVEVATRLAGIRGVLPVLDSHLPEEPSRKDPAWLLMPIAKPLAKVLRKKGLEDVVGAVEQVAVTLAEAVELGITHRDIKPANLLYRDDVEIGDWGLATFPEKEDRTAIGKKLGSTWFIAPEMTIDGGTRGPAADVFSLAKTLWVLATGNEYPIQGHQVASNPQLRLSTYVDHSRAHLLDDLVDRATHPTPEERPSMREVAHELATWRSLVETAPSLTNRTEIVKRLGAATDRIATGAEQRRRLAEEVERVRGRLVELTSPLVSDVRSLPGPDGGVQLDPTDQFDRYVRSETLVGTGFPFAVAEDVPGWGPQTTWLWIGVAADLDGDRVRAHVACTVMGPGDEVLHGLHCERVLDPGAVATEAALAELVTELARGVDEGLEVFTRSVEWTAT